MAAELAIIAKLQDEASSGIRALRGEVEGLGTSGETAGRGFSSLQAAGTVALTAIATAAAAAGAAIIGFVASSVSKAAELEAQMDTVAALLGATAEQAELLRQATLDLALDPNLAVSATEAAQAIEMLAQNGLTVEQILGGAAEATVQLANATGADFATAARIATDAMALWGMEADQLGQVADGVTAVLVQSKFEVNDYALALAQAGGVAAAVGVSFEDFNATLVAIAPYFASGSDAGTSYKTMLQRLIPTTTAAKDAMAALGMITEEGANAFFNADGSMKDMAEVAGILNNALAGLSEQQRLQALSTIFGTDAMRAAAAMSQFTEEEFRNLMAVMANTSAAEIAAQRMQNFSGAMDIVRGVLEGLQLMLGNVLLPILTELALSAAKLLSAWGPPVIAVFEAFINNLQEGMSVIDAFIEAIWNIAPEPVLNALVAFRDSILPIIERVGQAITSFVSWKDVLIALGIAIASVIIPALISIVSAIAPIALTIGGVILAVAALRNAWESDFLGIRSAVEGLVETFGRFVEAIRVLTDENARVQAMADVLAALPGPLQALALGVSTFLNALRDGEGLVAAFQAGLETLKQAIFTWAGAEDWSGVGQAILDKIASAFANLGDRAATTAAGILNWISTSVNSIDWNAVGQTIINGIAAAITAVVGGLVTAGTAIVNFFNGFFTNESLQSAGQGVVTALGNAISDAVSGMSTALDNIKQAIMDWAGVTNWSEVGGVILDKIAETFTNLGDRAAEVGANILNWISDAVNGIEWREVGETIINGISAAVAAAVGLLVTAGTAIVNFFTGFFTNDEIGPAGQNIITSLSNAISEFAGGISDGLANVRQAIFDWAGAEDWQGVADTIATKIGEAMATAKEFVSSKLSEWRQAIFDWAGAEDWQGVAEHISSQIGEKLGEAKDAIDDQLGEWQQAIFDWADAEDWLGVAEHIADMIGEKLGEAKDSISSKLSDWRQAILDWADAEDWPGVATHIAELVGVALGEADDQVVAGMDSWYEGMSGWASEADWNGIAATIAQAMGSNLVANAATVTGELDGWVGAIDGWAGDADWGGTSQTIAEMIGQGLADEVESVTEKLSGWVTGFTDWVERTDWAQVGYDIMFKITDAFLDFKTTVTTKIATWLADLKAATEGYAWYEIGGYILLKIIEALGGGGGGEGGGGGGGEGGTSWDSVVATWLTEIRNAIVRVQASLQQLGRDIVAGIAAGISAAVELVSGAIAGVIGATQQAGADAAGAQSPARAFMPLGNDITAGVAVGITQNVSAVISAIQQVAQAIELEGVKAFGEAMQAIAAGIAAAMSAILDIGSFQGGGDGFGAAMQALVDMMAAMVAAVAAANTYTVEVLENLGTFVEAAEAINDLLLQTADVVDYIGRWRAPDIAAANASIQLLVGFLAQMVQGIVGLNLEAMLILGELGNFLDSAAELPGLFMGVADIVSYLAAWRAPGLEPVIDNVHQLAGLLGTLVTAVAGANTMGLGMLDILAAFIETAAGIVALIAPLADAILDIANFPPGAELSIMQRNIETMAGYLAQIVTAVAGANTMGLLSLEQLSAFVEVAADIVDLINPMAEAMFGIANFPQGTDVQVMARNIEIMAGYLRDLVAAIAESNSWGQLTLELLDTFVQVAGSIAELITPLAEAIWNIANFRSPDLFAFVGSVATLAGHLSTIVVWFYSGLNLSQAALEVLGQYVEVMGAIAEGMVTFIDAIAAIAAFQPPDLFTFIGNIATLAGHLSTMVAWFYNGLNLSQAALEALGQYIEVISSIAEGMVAFIDAIAAVASFQPPDLFTFVGNMATLAGHLSTMVVWFYNGLNLSMAALEALGQYVEVIGDLVDLIADAIEALGLVAAYSGNTAALGPAVAAFAADLLLLVQTLAAGFASASAASLEAIVAAGEFADAVGDILDVVEDGVDALMALAGYVPAANLLPTAQQFAADLATVITTVVNALQLAGILAGTAIVAAGELADGLGDVLGMVEDGVGALVELANYIPTAGLGTLAQQFANDLATVITAVVNALVAAQLLASEAVVKAGELSDGLADILGVVAEGVEAIAALASYIPAAGIGEKAQQFAADLAAVITAIVNGLVQAGLLANQAVAAAGELAGRLSDLLGVVAAGIEAIRALSEYQGVEGLQAKVQVFTSDLIAVATLLATQLTLAANTIGAATIDAARAFATAVTALAGEVQAAMTALGQLAGMAAPNIQPVLAYIVASAQQIQTAFSSAGDIGQAVAYAAAFRANLQQLVTEIQAAVAALNQIAGTGTSGSVGAALAAIAASLQNTQGQFAGAGSALANALITALAGGIGAGQGQVWGALEAVLGNTYASGLRAASLFGNVGKEIAEYTASGIVSGQGQVVAAVAQVVGAAIAAGINEAKRAADIGRQLIQAALAEVNAGRGQLDSAGNSAGNAMIDGMVRAILAGKSRLVNAIKDAVSAAVAAAKAALGIASPSKVATELLANFMNTAARTVDSLRGNLADSMAAALSGAATAAAAGLSATRLSPQLAPAYSSPGAALAERVAAAPLGRTAGNWAGAGSGSHTQVVFYGNVVLPNVVDPRSFLEELDALRGAA